MYWLNNNGKIEKLSLNVVAERNGRKSLTRYDLEFRVTNLVSDATFDFLKKYGLRPTIFNCSCFEKFKHILVYPYYALYCVKQGAKISKELLEEIRKDKFFKDNPEYLKEFENLKGSDN